MTALRPLRLLILSACALVLALGGCGGDSGSGDAKTSASESSDSSEEVAWPFFGRVTERTHYIADAPDPPFRYLWEFDAGQLIEFPPVLENGRVFVMNKVGLLSAVDAETGKKIWDRKFDADVTGPAFANGVVYVALYGGEMIAVDAEKAKLKWQFKAEGHLESSPVIADGKVYFGDDRGYLYALEESSGKLAWKHQLGKHIKASPSFSDGAIYVGDYEGAIHAVEASSGKVRWTADTTAMPPGGSGGFYSSPAIGFGHVYEARDDGVVYAVDQHTGKLVWHFDTSNQIYGSPAVADVPGTPPSVYIGSYNHQLYALDAQTGKKRWRFNVGGQVPGTPTVVGSTVYTSSFQTKRTYGVSAKTGKRVFSWGSAGYTPVISDGERAYLTGFQTVWGFDAKNPGGG